MAFFKEIGKSITSSLDIGTKSISNIFKPISINLGSKVTTNKGLINDIIAAVKGGIETKILGGQGFLDGVLDVVKTKIDISGLLDPLLGILNDFSDNVKSKISESKEGISDFLGDFIDNVLSKISESLPEGTDILGGIYDFFIGKLSEKLGIPTDILSGNLGSLKGSTLKLSSPAQMDALIEWINEVSSFILGVKPFAIMEGKADFIDFTKDDLYHKIMQTIVLIYFTIKMFTDNFKAYLTYPYDAYLREIYKLEKLGLNDYITLYRRDLIGNETLESNAKFLGYDSDTLDNAKMVTEFFPSVRDIIDFAVREAFEPDEKLFIHGLNAIPEPFIEFGKKTGLTEQWIKKFWHSHWRLLGVGQVVDAFHRNLLNEVDTLDYLRRLDYNENDQKLLRDLSFNLLTRVDIRRIYENGLMSTKQLFEYYQTLGFSFNDAGMMTMLGKQVRFIETKDLRKIYIEQFEGGFLTVSEIRDRLRATGLDSDEISLYLEISDTQNELEFKLELKKQIELRFYEGIIDFDELISQLRDLGVSNRELRRIERNASLYRYRKPRLPTMAELKRYIKKDIITIQEFIYYGLRLGLDVKHLEWILIDIGWLK